MPLPWLGHRARRARRRIRRNLGAAAAFVGVALWFGLWRIRRLDWWLRFIRRKRRWWVPF